MSYLRERGMLSGQATGEIVWTGSMTRKETSVLVKVNVTNDPRVKLIYPS